MALYDYQPSRAGECASDLLDGFAGKLHTDGYDAYHCKLPPIPKSFHGMALTYAVNQESWLMNVFLDGRLELSNNRAERSVRPFAVERKNWLFCNTPNGADASAAVYSIIETAKANGLKPFAYLKFLLERLPYGIAPEDCLPWGEAAQKLYR